MNPGKEIKKRVFPTSTMFKIYFSTVARSGVSGVIPAAQSAKSGRSNPGEILVDCFWQKNILV